MGMVRGFGRYDPVRIRRRLVSLTVCIFWRISVPMKMTIDLALIIGMAICYVVGQFVAANAFSGVVLALLLVFLVRLIGGAVSWVVTGC